MEAANQLGTGVNQLWHWKVSGLKWGFDMI